MFFIDESDNSAVAAAASTRRRLSRSAPADAASPADAVLTDAGAPADVVTSVPATQSTQTVFFSRERMKKIDGKRKEIKNIYNFKS